MPITIGSNIASLKTQRQLTKTSNELASVYERLSSGMRINKASDDAAGLSIATSLNADRRIFTQGVRNLNDGLSLLAIADSAVHSLTDIAVRLKELAEQSANGTYSAKQRSAIDKEAQALSKEFTRIIQSTKFNEQYLLNGSLSEGLRLQAGYGDLGSIYSGLGGAIGTGTFAASVSYNLLNGPRGVVSADFNNDGYLDIASSSDSSSAIGISLGNGAGGFSSVGSLLNVGESYDITTGDFNGDGVTDLVSANLLGNSISVFIGRNDGSFNAAVSYQSGTTPRSVSSGDFNNDGIDDIVTSDSAGGSLSVFIGKGNGTFSTRVSYAVSATPRYVSTADFNGDGILDLVSADYNSSSISVLMGRGDGSFGTRVSYASDLRPTMVQSADLNGDGKLDIVSTGQANNTVDVYLNAGDGTFATRISYTLNNNPHGVALGDFNGDGHIDIAASDIGETNILIGRGNGTFNQQISYTEHNSSADIIAGDFNTDGVLDLARVNVGGAANSISILIGNTRDGTSPLHEFSLMTQSEAKQALSVFTQKIGQLVAQRGQIGAFQSRVEVGINNLQSVADNYAFAESRIRDADIAAETANLVRLQILQQASAAILGQANLQPQLALRLLNGGRS